MWISRVRVNGGFLAGLDVRLEPGLNVVIGPRGAGKTTLLELIRHGLGIAHADRDEAKRRDAAVRALLGAGEVVLDLEENGVSHHLVVDATGRGRALDRPPAALALGQNELERIASDASSRLNLIDLRASVLTEAPSLDVSAALTESLAHKRAEVARLEEFSSRRALLEADRAEAAAEERQLLGKSVHDLSSQRDELRAIETDLLHLSGQVEDSSRASDGIARAIEQALDLESTLRTLPPAESGLALDALISRPIHSILDDLSSAETKLREVAASLVNERHGLSERQVALQLRAEPIRSELEAAEAGLGQVTARLRNIDSELEKLSRADADVTELERRITTDVAAREALLDEYEGWQESLYGARREIADSVSNDLNGRVVVSVTHLADTASYRDTLVELLQGSGLQYRPLSELMARALLPRQLLSLVERSDISGLADATGVPFDRAARVVGHLSDPKRLGALSRSVLNDKVDFRLRDGASEKSVEELSTGQKCAVTLPIVLTESTRMLILDQPEDHLDNAYLVGNVVQAFERRQSQHAQTIVATHNANIPVLGSAEVVLSLESDGARGYVAQSGAFDDDKVVDVITSLMEGGREAFKRRAAFYAEHGVRDD